MTKILGWLNDFVWGAPALVLILGVGVLLSVGTGFAQITLFPRALGRLGRMLRPGNGSDRSSFRALCTALGATVGTGNLAGVAGAICLGGPGAVFWMWVCGLLGMVTKYAEAVLAVRFRDSSGNGGPMYVMTRGLGPRWKPLAAAYSLFGVIAAFGVGSGTQINAVITGCNGLLVRGGYAVSPRRNLAMGLILAVVLGAMLLGGAGRIGRAAERLVPFAAAGYVLLCLGVLVIRRQEVPGALVSIVQGAFSPGAVTGGAVGAAFQALRVGCRRGVFTNEAGMGTASIAHAGAAVSHPAEQGLMGLVEVFADTLVICTLTALVILVSGVSVPYGTDAGAALTTQAFAGIYGDPAAVLLTAALILFAVATVLGWGLYGGRCAQYLFGTNAWTWFALTQTAAIAAASVMPTGTVWQLAETVNGLMAIPNLIALAMLAPEVSRLTKEYKKIRRRTPVEVHYADFHQCKPL